MKSIFFLLSVIIATATDQGCDRATGSSVASALCDVIQSLNFECDWNCNYFVFGEDPDPACWCECWANSEFGLGPDNWLQTIPQCPQSLGNGRTCPNSPDDDVWNAPLNEDEFHPGSSYCIRSNNMADGGPGQQCCYDNYGDLITEGLGAGTPDLTAPVGPYDASQHCIEDVQSFERCVEADMFDCYLSRRTPSRSEQEFPHNVCVANAGDNPQGISCWIANTDPENTLNIDGQMGPITISALQKFLNANRVAVSVTGTIDTSTIRALQTFLNSHGANLSVDGALGPNTARALQQFLAENGFPTGVDGVWGSGTTRSLQQFLHWNIC